MLKQLENKLDQILVKKAPGLPASGKTALVEAMPWIAIIGGVLTLWAAWGVYQLVMWSDRWLGWSNNINVMYGPSYTPMAGVAGPVAWLSIIIMVAEAVLFFVAFKNLQARKKAGWNTLFLIGLLNVANAIIYLFVDHQITSLVFSLVGALIGLYVLFQVRSYYVSSGSKPKTSKK